MFLVVVRYNLVWDKILKLNLIPQEVFDTEVAFYAKNFETYGLRLDNRKDLTKTDWFVTTMTTVLLILLVVLLSDSVSFLHLQ